MDVSDSIVTKSKRWSLWRQRIVLTLAVSSSLACVSNLILGNTGGFFFGLFGFLLAGILSGPAKELLSTSTNPTKDAYRTIQIAEGLRLELYRSGEDWLAPILFKNISKYGRYRWHDSCRKWTIRHTPEGWAEVVKCIYNNDRRMVRRQTYYTDGGWVLIYDD